MGLFCLPHNELGIVSKEDVTADQLVQCAIANLELWRRNPSADYLIHNFAMSMLNDAMRKLRPLEDDTIRNIPDVPSDQEPLL